MTGLRQGELLALRWRDIDWLAGRIRVRRNYVRGEFGAPKSRRSSRSVPMADRLLGELDVHQRHSRHRGDDDLVFAHPALGVALDRSRRSRSGAQPRRRNKRSNQDLIMDYLANHESGTASAIAHATGANRNSLATALNAMTVGGVLEKADPGYRMAGTADRAADAGAGSRTQPATDVTQ